MAGKNPYIFEVKNVMIQAFTLVEACFMYISESRPYMQQNFKYMWR